MPEFPILVPITPDAMLLQYFAVREAARYAMGDPIWEQTRRRLSKTCSEMDAESCTSDDIIRWERSLAWW